MAEPVVRFKDNNGCKYPDWIECQLQDIAERVTRKNKNNETDIPLTISSLDGLVDQRTYFGKTIASRDMSGYFLLQNGEFAYNKSYSVGFDFGSIKRLDKYDQGALSTLYICFGLKDESISDYMTHYFNSLVWNKEMPKICAEGDRNHGLLNVPPADFFKININIPASAEEREKIVSMLNEIESLISTITEEVRLWEEKKKGIIQKIFSQEVRFKDENGEDYPEWEERFLGNFCDITTGKLDANAMVENGKYDFYTSGIAKYKINEYAFEGPAITVAGNGATVGYLHLADGKFNAYQRTYVLTNFKAVREYLYFVIGIKLPLKIRKEVRARSIPYIVYNMLSELEIPVPCLAEQQKIADCLSSIDEVIEIKKQKLETWKNIKQGLFQQMFV